MADIVDRANDDIDRMIEARRTIKAYRKLVAVGACHYCDELLPRVGQLFCNSGCGEDYETEQAQRKRSGIFFDESSN